MGLKNFFSLPTTNRFRLEVALLYRF